MTAFDAGWAVLKMPYYHGTSSANAQSIMREGLRPHGLEESHWSHNDVLGSYDRGAQVFFSDRPYAALRYGLSGATEGFYDDARQDQVPPHRPIVIEISDDVEGLEGFEFNPRFHDFRTTTTIPPEMLRVVYEGENYPDDPEMEYGSMEAVDWGDLQEALMSRSPFIEEYRAMGEARHPPFVRREGLV